MFHAILFIAATITDPSVLRTCKRSTCCRTLALQAGERRPANRQRFEAITPATIASMWALVAARLFEVTRSSTMM